MKLFDKKSNSLAKVKFFIISIMLTNILTGFSQEFPADPTQINEIPTSPTMWEFEKYGEYPVSLHTGVPEISIPIATIESGDIRLPIHLSYHASGIKVDQKASWVGLGWTLIAGGAITRTVRGTMDEGQQGYINYPFDDQGEFDPANDHYTMEEMMQGYIDTEPDIFSYNFLGYSGKFVLNHEDASVALIPHNDLKINPTITGNNIVSFSITTPDGIVAEFAEYETAEAVMPEGMIAGAHTIYANSVWHLVQLTASNGIDTMTFEYKLTGTSPGNVGVVIEDRISQFESFNFYDPCWSYNYSNAGISTRSPDVRYNLVKRLERINFRNGYVLFDSSDGNRDDDPDDEYLRLDKISVYSKLGSNEDLIKSFDLAFGYFGSIDISQPNPEYQVRLKLETVQESGSANGQIPPYEISYRETGTEQLPPRFSNSQDYWGYYNGKSNNSLIPAYQYTLFSGTSNETQVTLGNADRNVYPAHSTAGIIDKIVYPTGGYSIFEFESNEATITDVSGTNEYLIGGLRVNNISSFATEGVLAWQKSYEYYERNNPNFSSGVYNGTNPLDPKDFFSSRDYWFSDASGPYSCQASADGSLINYQTKTHTISSSPANSRNFASVFYGSVIEYQGTPTQHEGYTWYEFEVEKDTYYQGSGPLSFLIDKSWDRGQLRIKETFETGNITPVLSETYNFEEISTQNPVRGYKPARMFDVQYLGYVPTVGWDTYSFRSLQYYLVYYDEPIIWKRLAQKTIVKNGVTTQEDYSYNTSNLHTKVIESSMVDSKNNFVVEQILYPEDVLSNSTLLDGSLDYNTVLRLKSGGPNPRIGLPLQSISINNGSKYTSRTIMKDWGNGLILSNKQKSLKGELTAQNAIQNGIEINSYDVLGNPLEIFKSGGPVISYIWGYNGTYPIAKIENANYSEIASALEITLNTLQNYDEGDISLINGLRNGSLNNAKVTTYTYDLLIGVTSITDPRGHTANFIYDEHGRFIEVRDNQDNLVSDYQYNYKGQN